MSPFLWRIPDTVVELRGSGSLHCRKMNLRFTGRHRLAEKPEFTALRVV
jgi:hypothetical protein